ncbi:MAG: hypothetical protein ABIO39_02165 [Caulobacteraceae bacterium]
MRSPAAGASLAKPLTLLILALGFVAVLVANLPGQLSFDSVVQLHDGRTGAYNSWHPPIMAWLLGLGDAVLPGTAVFVTLNAGLLFASLGMVVAARRRVGWLAPLVAAAMAVSPLVLIYQGIVWKDVLFANTAVAGFLALSQAGQVARPRWRIALVVWAFGLFGVASLIRQNGLLVLLAGAAALGCTLGFGGRARLKWAVGLAVAAFGVTLALAFITEAALMTRRIDALGPVAQLRALQGYDIIGAVSHDPGIDLSQLGSPALERRWRDAAAKVYTPERMDPLYDALEIGKVSAVPNAAVARQWRAVATGHSQAFLRHRWEVFRWTFFTPVLTQCLPVWAGVDGPANLLEDLDLVEQQRPQDEALEAYATRFYGTPVFSHVFYAVLAIAALLLLARIRRAGDGPIAFMLLSAIGFAASFALISLACDYRYLYFLDLAAMVAAFHLALGRKSG